jgi:hypothetical protein
MAIYFRKGSGVKNPHIVGTIQLPALVGAPDTTHAHPSEILQSAGFQAVKEAEALMQAGFDGVILQNTGDFPHFPNQVPSDTLVCLAIIAAAVREVPRITLGIEVLWNDPRAALSIAAATGCEMIRVKASPELARTTPSRFAQKIAELFRERGRLHAPVALLGDVGTSSSPLLSLGSWDGLIAAPTLDLQLDATSDLYWSIDSAMDWKAFQARRDQHYTSGLIFGSLPKTSKGLDTKRLKEWVQESKQAFKKRKSVKK